MMSTEELEVNWYVVHTYSGYENKVKANLEKRIETMEMQDYIYRIIVPTSVEVEEKEGKRVEKEKKSFPGYVLVEMKMLDEAWYVVRNTPGVTGFVGSHGNGSKPNPLMPWEVDSILESMGSVEEKVVGLPVEIGEVVFIKAGPFAESEGKITEIDAIHGKVVVDVEFFGRSTAVELPMNDISKIEL